MSLVHREIVSGDETGARQQATIDHIMDRLERIARRLELHMTRKWIEEDCSCFTNSRLWSVF